MAVDPSGMAGADPVASTGDASPEAASGVGTTLAGAESDGASGALDTTSLDDTQGESEGGTEDDGASAEAVALARADQADLEQYPETVRDYLKGIPQEHRKTLHEHFGQRERARMLEEQERANKLEADR